MSQAGLDCRTPPVRYVGGMRRYFPIFIAAAALLAAGILYAFVLHGDTAHTGTAQPVESR